MIVIEAHLDKALLLHRHAAGEAGVILQGPGRPGYFRHG